MRWMLVAVAALGLVGCGIRRQNVHVQVPALHVNPDNGPQIVLASVTDSRQPQPGWNLSTGEQARNVGGVIRGGSGIAVNLENQSVVEESRQIVIQALRGIGYKVVDTGGAGIPQITVDVTSFRVDMPFSIWRTATYSQKMLADVSANVAVNKGDAKRLFTVSGHGENVYQRVVEENWEVALNRAIADFTQKLQKQMASIE